MQAWDGNISHSDGKIGQEPDQRVQKVHQAPSTMPVGAQPRPRALSCAGAHDSGCNALFSIENFERDGARQSSGESGGH
jgi:hypothetical protein